MKSTTINTILIALSYCILSSMVITLESDNREAKEILIASHKQWSAKIEKLESEVYLLKEQNEYQVNQDTFRVYLHERMHGWGTTMKKTGAKNGKPVYNQ